VPNKPKSPFLPKVKYWFTHHKKLAIILGVLFVLLLAGATATAFYFLNQKPEVAVTTKRNPNQHQKRQSSIRHSVVI
jgi:flagellar basal body-associated protein FliL